MDHPIITIDLIASCARSIWAGSLFGIKNTLLRRTFALASAAALASLMACTTPQPPVAKAVYDFGPMLTQAAATSVATLPAGASRSPTIALPEIEAGAGLDSPALLYRLQYADAQHLLPYAQARWSVPPAQLVRARLRDALSSQGAVLPSEGGTPWVLRVELDEFSQVFASPTSSQGVIRLRVSLMKDDKLVAQTTLLARANAPSQDAAGGVKALTAATDDAVRQLSAWLAPFLK
jgi:cholesterol transport system auxiliary component